MEAYHFMTQLQYHVASLLPHSIHQKQVTQNSPYSKEDESPLNGKWTCLKTHHSPAPGHELFIFLQHTKQTFFQDPHSPKVSSVQSIRFQNLVIFLESISRTVHLDLKTYELKRQVILSSHTQNLTMGEVKRRTGNRQCHSKNGKMRGTRKPWFVAILELNYVCVVRSLINVQSNCLGLAFGLLSELLNYLYFFIKHCPCLLNFLRVLVHRNSRHQRPLFIFLLFW